MTTKSFFKRSKNPVADVKTIAGTFVQGEWRWYCRPFISPRDSNDTEARFVRSFAGRTLFNTLWMYEDKSKSFEGIEVCDEC